MSPWVSERSTDSHPVSFLNMVGATEKPKSKSGSPDFSQPPPVQAPTEEETENEEFFGKRYKEECQEIEEIDLGPDFVYPSQRAFEKYLGEFDFMKHLKHGILAKFDGTVKKVPGL